MNQCRQMLVASTDPNYVVSYIQHSIPQHRQFLCAGAWMLMDGHTETISIASLVSCYLVLDHLYLTNTTEFDFMRDLQSRSSIDVYRERLKRLGICSLESSVCWFHISLLCVNLLSCCLVYVFCKNPGPGIEGALTRGGDNKCLHDGRCAVA